jgi:hypothetical protein
MLELFEDCYPDRSYPLTVWLQNFRERMSCSWAKITVNQSATTQIRTPKLYGRQTWLKSILTWVICDYSKGRL